MKNTLKIFSVLITFIVALYSNLATAINIVNIIDDYGAPGDGTSDETQYFIDAVADLKAQGGGVILARGTHKINLVILEDKITIQGLATIQKDISPYAPRLQPWDSTKPVVQWGDGNLQVRGGGLRDISLHGSQSDEKGLVINGLREGIFENVTIHGFTDIGLDISSHNYSTAHIHFTNFTISSSNITGAKGMSIRNSTGTSYTSAIYFTGGRISGSTGGYAVEVDDVRIGMTDVYADLHDGHGFYFTPGGIIAANGLTLDSGSSTDVLVEIPDENPITDYIFGTANIDGKVKFNYLGQATEVSISGLGIGDKYRTVHNYPIVMGAIYINDNSDPATAYELNNKSAFSRSGSNINWQSPSKHRFMTNGTERLKLSEYSIDAKLPVQFRSYTVNSLPGAASAASVRSIVWVTDGNNGPGHAYSDGTNWLWLSDKTIVTP